jgi:hypothetical protein
LEVVPGCFLAHATMAKRCPRRICQQAVADGPTLATSG